MPSYMFREHKVLVIKAKDQADPNQIGQALDEIGRQNRGHLTPRRIITAASDRKHVLHKHFEWDDSVAAQEWRLEQARSLVQAIHVQADTESGVVRAFVSVRDEEGISYRTISDVMSSINLQQRLLVQAERDLHVWE